MPAPAWPWLLLGIGLLLILPLLGGPLVLVDLAVAALVLAVVTAAVPGLDVAYQLLIYLATTLAFLPSCYAVAFRLRGRRRAAASGNACGGEQGVVVRRGRGLGVRVHGETFPARAADGGELRLGEAVTVVRLRGITAYVRRADGSPASRP